MSATTISPLDTVDAIRAGDDLTVEIRPVAVADENVVTLVLRSNPPPVGVDDGMIEDLDLVPASAARLVGLLVDALDKVDPIMAAAARTLAGAR